MARDRMACGWWWVLLIAGSIFFAGCSGSKLCCDRQNPESDKAKYCSAHKAVVVKYLKAFETDEAKRRQVDILKDFMGQIRKCEFVDCMERKLYAEVKLNRFMRLYTLDHGLVERETRLKGRDKLAMVKCGFDSGIEMIDADLLTRGQ